MKGILRAVDIIEHKDEIEITKIQDFSPPLIFECGQCFRWDVMPDGSYVGIAKGKAARVNKKNGSVFISGTIDDFNLLWRDYFDLDRDYAQIRSRVAIDEFMQNATDYGTGIRILRQDRWEALCSFIISQCNNIKRIKGIISRFCELYGHPINFLGKTMYTFPTVETVASLNADDLAPIRSGYRAPYIISAAKRIESGQADLDYISTLSEPEMLRELKQFDGVGNKVANCVMLFGFHRLDSFPIDVWIKRTVGEIYGKNFDPSVFGQYAGVAQQYMFHYARTGGAVNV